MLVTQGEIQFRSVQVGEGEQVWLKVVEVRCKAQGEANTRSQSQNNAIKAAESRGKERARHLHCSKANPEKGTGSTTAEQMEIGEYRNENTTQVDTYLPPKTTASTTTT